MLVYQVSLVLYTNNCCLFFYCGVGAEQMVSCLGQGRVRGARGGRRAVRGCDRDECAETETASKYHTGFDTGIDPVPR